MARVRSLMIFTNIQVFLDRLSTLPGEMWQSRIGDELKACDMLWLFWSRNAARSPWVQWEWQTAVSLHGAHFIQPHPLEPATLAPPPAELAHLQFGSLLDALAMDPGMTTDLDAATDERDTVDGSWWARQQVGMAAVVGLTTMLVALLVML